MGVSLGLAKWTVLCILLTSVLAQKCTKKCPSHRSPVCGSDGQTYKNQCKLENRACYRPNLFLLSDGDCNLQGCRRTCVGPRAQVCGTDGVTYNSLCDLDNAACNDAGISLRAHGRCPKEAILTAFESKFDASDPLSQIVFEIIVESAAGSQPVQGRDLWKLGIYGCRYDDGWCDKVNHITQILSEEQAATPLGAGDKMTIKNIRADFDVSIIGCDELRYLCTEFSKGSDPRPDYVLTMPGHFESAIMCFELPCVPGTEPPLKTPACRYECPESGNIVCGSDGMTYDTECALDNENRCSEDPNSYLLQRKHYGPCRTGVIIDSIFWSARGSDGTRVELESLIMSNSTGESISGRSLWKMGIYGSRFEDGSGPRLGYIPQLLDDSQASTTFAAGKAIVMNVEAEFDVAAVGCSRYRFLCLEFTKGDSPQPPFPFTGNSGPEENGVFVACKQVPCNGQPERDIPDDGRKRVYVGELGWGLKAGSRRSDGDYDVTVTLNAQILGIGDRVSGNNLVRVGLFGSKNIYGEGERFAFRKQILSRSQTSVDLRPNSNLVIEDIETHFPVTGLGCSEYGYLCAELGKSETTNQDFLLIPESLDISSTDDSVLICKEIPCSNPGGNRPGINGGNGGTTESKTGRVASLSWNLKVSNNNSPAPSDLAITVTAPAHQRSDDISGEGLWRVGLYASEDSDPLGPKERYTRQILSYEQQSAPLGPNIDLALIDISTQFDVTGLGCGELNYICLEFTRGDSPEPYFVLPLPQEDIDGVTERIASCKAWPWCQGGSTHTGGSTSHGGSESHAGGNMGHESGTGGSNHGTGGHGNPSQEDSLFAAFANVRWGRRQSPDRSGNKDLVMQLTPHPLSSPISGRNLWRVGLFGSDVSDGSGTRFEEIENILSNSDRSKPLVLGETLDFTIRTPNDIRDMGCRHRYECIEFTKLLDSNPPFKLALGNQDTFVSCKNISCTEAVHTGGMGGTGHETGGHGGGTPPKTSTHQARPTGDAVALYNLRWTRPTISAKKPSEVNFRVLLTPQPYSSPIEGYNMWKLTMFGSDNADGSGMKFREINNVLFRGNLNKPVIPGQDMEFEIERIFNLAEASCAHPYLCLEFGKNAYSAVSFDLDVGATDTLVSCKKLTCDDRGSDGGSNPSAPYRGPRRGGDAPVALSNLRWSHPTTKVDDPSKITFRVMLTPQSHSGSIEGYNMWKLTVFGSEEPDGSGMRFREINNILSRGNLNKPVIPGQNLEFEIERIFNLADAGCAHRYLCLEFAKNGYSSVAFDLNLGETDTLVSCKRLTCADGGGQGGGNPPNTGSNRGGMGEPSQGGNPQRGGAVALSSLRWSHPTTKVDDPSKITFRVMLTPQSHSGSIEGYNMWKLTVFGSEEPDGSGMRFREIDNILSRGNLNKPVIPGQNLEFEIERIFNLADAGCAHRYLCLEFAKNRYSSVPFELNLGKTDTLVSCKRLTCADGGGQGGDNPPNTGSNGDGMGEPSHGGNPQSGGAVALSSLRWTRPTTSSDNPSVVTFRAMLTPGTHSSSVEGYNMWKMTMFGSDRADGSQMRFREINNVLTGGELNKPVIPGQNLEFSVERIFDLAEAGCAHPFLCIEFSKNRYSSVTFSIDLGDTGTLISCKRLTCDDSGSQTPTNTGHGGGNPPETPAEGAFVIFSKLNWGRLPSTQDRPGDINLNVTLTPNPHTNPLSGSRLWRVGLFGSDAADGAGTRYQEQPNVLSRSDQNNAVTPTQRLEFGISTPFDLSNIGCVHPYLCIEFAKNRYSSPSFILRLGSKDSLVACQRVSCNPNTGHTPGGHTPGGHQAGIDRSLPTARFYNISWIPTPGEVRAGRITNLNIHATLFPNHDTDTITGKRLWRIGLYGNMYKDGTGPERLHYDEQILTPKQAKTPLRPNAPLVFDVDTRFPLENFGCDLHRYLCIEFAQHSYPIPEFNFPIENGAHVSCRPYFCQDQPYPEPEPEPAPNQNVARVNNFSWRIGNTNINANGLTDLRVFVNVTARADTDTISGQNLWRVGVYGSRVQHGVGSHQDRYDYNPQILQVHDARRVFAPNRPLKFDVNTRFDMRQLGCGPYKYFCVEFGKDSLAAPDFYMPLTNGDVTVSCQRSICPEGGRPDSGAQPNQGTMKTARFSKIHWRLLGPTVYSNGDSDLRILMDITPHPSSDRIDGGVGSGLWRVGIFANSNAMGTHPMKVNYERQILSQEDRDRSLIPSGQLNFDMSTPFNLRRAHCDSQYPFLCMEIAKGETAWPDFNLPFPRDADSYISCQPSPCLETDTRVHSDVPVAIVTSVNMAGATIQPDVENNLFLDVRVNMADDSSTIRGANLWRVEMWGSKSATGQGPQIGHSSQVLSETQTDRSYVPPEPVYFAAVRFSLDMRRKRCTDVTYMCAKFSKQDIAVPEFRLQASPNSGVLTTCRPVDCSTPSNSQITVTGLSLYQTTGTGLRSGRPNTLTIGARITYDSGESVSFSGTNMWSLQMWMSAKVNGKGNKVSAVNQALDTDQASVPFEIGRELQFRGIEFSVNLMGKRCKVARYVCATLSKNARSSEPYELLSRPNPKSLTKCLPVNCS